MDLSTWVMVVVLAWTVLGLVLVASIWSRAPWKAVMAWLGIALVPVGHLVGRLPVGNTGGSNVSAFKPMAIPPDLERLIEDRDR